MKRLAVLLCVVVGACAFYCSACSSGAGEMLASRPITTVIPEGIYLGEITRHEQFSVNGVPGDDTITVTPYQEIVDENGLPLVQPSGEVPVEGLVVDTDIGTVSSRLRVESVNASGNRLVIGFTGSMEFEGILFGSVGTWTYEYTPPNRLDYIHLITWVSEASDFGDVVTMSSTAQATLIACLAAGCPNTTTPCDYDFQCADDGWFCSGIERCVNGVCASSGDPCDRDTQVCDEAANVCVTVCTDDAQCYDGYFYFCNGVQECLNGRCVSSGYPCDPDTQECDEDWDLCITLCTDAASCDDGNDCTDDACNAYGECYNTNNAAACDDGNDCTEDDVCADGACVGTVVCGA